MGPAGIRTYAGPVTSVAAVGRRGGGILARLLLLVLVAVVAGVLSAGLLLPAIGGIGAFARGSTESFESLPADLQAAPLPQRSRILAADGSLIATFYDQNRISVPLAAIAPIMRTAIVAIEDSRFYEHGGIDLRGTTRALVNNARGQDIQGGSTLTQQYVKNVLIEAARTDAEREAARARTPARKLREARYAIALEEKLGKDEILNRYLNIAYFGQGAYGVEAASRQFFGVPAASLTLPQAATLAGLVQNPSTYDPTLAPRLALSRRNVVLDRMAELGDITPEAAAKARAGGLGLKFTKAGNGCESSGSPFFCDYVLHVMRLDPAFGATRDDRVHLLLAGGLTIRTTLDRTVQVAAKRAVDSAIPPTDKSGIATAIALVEPGTGKVLALAENRTWGTDPAKGQTQVNYAVDYAYGGSTGAQAGSTFKAFTLAAAIKAGIPMSTFISSPPVKTFKNFVECGTGRPFPPYTVPNSTGSGVFDMRTGTWLSVNTFYVGLEERTGLCDPVAVAESMGMRTASGQRIERVPSFTLGTSYVSPLRLANAYATFAARGMYCDPVVVTSVVDSKGTKLPLPKTSCRRVLDKAVADAVSSVLAGVIDGPDPRRTGRAMSIDRPAAGKTGTTDGHMATWFAGFTPALASAVWVGDPAGRKELQNITIDGRYYPTVFGGSIAGPVWQRTMSQALEGVPARPFAEIDPTVIQGARVRVPDVVGMSPARATAELAAVGLYGLTGRSIDSTVRAGAVADTSPGPGARVSSGTAVRLYLSTGTAPAPSPSPTPVTPPPASAPGGIPPVTTPVTGPVTPPVAPKPVKPGKPVKPVKPPAPPR